MTLTAHLVGSTAVTVVLVLCGSAGSFGDVGVEDLAIGCS